MRAKSNIIIRENNLLSLCIEYTAKHDSLKNLLFKRAIGVRSGIGDPEIQWRLQNTEEAN